MKKNARVVGLRTPTPLFRKKLKGRFERKLINDQISLWKLMKTVIKERLKNSEDIPFLSLVNKVRILLLKNATINLTLVTILIFLLSVQCFIWK